MGHFHRENVCSAGFGSESFLLDFTTNGILRIIAYKLGASKSTPNITKSITTQNQAEIPCKYRGESFLPESSFILQRFPFVTLSRYILSPTMHVLHRRVLPPLVYASCDWKPRRDNLNTHCSTVLRIKLSFVPIVQS